MIFQSRDNTKALTVSGNASGMTGTIYAPAAQLAESGNAQLNAAVIVDTMTISGNGVANTVTLDAPSGTVAYTPAQIRAAYGISALALDGTGQTIAIVDAYDDPSIFQALDAFDSQFGADRLRTVAVRSVRPSIVVLDGTQPERPGHVLAVNRPERTRHRQLGSRGVARRRMGACHRPGRSRSSWSRPTASRFPT